MDTSNNLDFSVISEPFKDVWHGVIEFLPKLIIALLIFIIVWWIGAVLGKVVAQFIRAIKLDKALKGVGVDSTLARGGFDLDTGAFFGSIVKWFFIIVGLLAALPVVGLAEVNSFLEAVVLDFLPDVFVAALILIVGALLAHFLQKLVSGSAKAADIPSAHFMGGIAKWAVWIFAILATLGQLGIAFNFVLTLFTGLVAMLALAGGLAFGLGGRDAAAKYIEKMRRDINER